MRSGFINEMLLQDENFSVYLENMLAIAHREKAVRDQIPGTEKGFIGCLEGYRKITHDL